jgi:hypothetical protein
MELTAQNNVSLSSLMNNILLYKYNPVNIQQVILNYLSDVMNGEVDVVDPTNPFVFLLEASTVSTAAAMMENELNTRRQYPALATTMDELYLHMSDTDFLDVFSSPATGEFYFIIEKKSLLSSLIPNPTTGTNQLIIGGNTFTIVDNLSFSLQYPIVVNQYPSGNVVISYDDSLISPIQSLNGTNIPYNMRTDANGVEWYSFKVLMTQVSIDTNTYPILESTYFNTQITYNNQFYYCRVFNQPIEGGEWTELLTTFTGQVYNPTTPTAVLKLLGNNTLEVSIPPVYVATGLLSGNIRIDIYETNGIVNVNLSNYLINTFVTTFLDLNETTANTEYYATANNLIYLCYSDQVINGGNQGLSLAQLRDQVINNSTGNNVLPITNSQLQANIQNNGFAISEKIDTLTNRIFTGSNSLPMPVNQDFITPVSVTMETIATSFSLLKDIPTANINSTGNRATLLPTTLYQNLNGVVSIYNNPNVAIYNQLNLPELQQLINNNSLLYTPFYYVLDNSANEFSVRVYNLTNILGSNLGFHGVNNTCPSVVNTGSFQFTKTATGFNLTVVTQSNSIYQNMPNGACGAQISFTSPVSGNKNYVSGTLLGQNAAFERIFSFDFNTEYDIDSNNILYIKGNNSSNAYTDIGVSLLQDFDIIYYLTVLPPNFKQASFQSYLNSTLITNNPTNIANPPIPLAAITHDSITLEFGQSLNYLWAQHRSVASSELYSKYTRDIVLRYTTDQYAVNPDTGSILNFVKGVPTFTLTASAGDPVLDKNGNPIYQYTAGDTIVDSAGKPKYLNYNSIMRYIDIMLFDATFYFITHQSTINYINGIIALITQWCTTTLEIISSNLIEQTEIFYYPQKTNTQVLVTLDNNTVTSIPTGQNLSIVFYVPSTVANNLLLQTRIENISTGLISNYFLTNNIITISQITKMLLDQFGSDVIDVQVSGLGGSSNYPFVMITDNISSLSINKTLSLLADGTLTVIENINYTFLS